MTIPEDFLFIYVPVLKLYASPPPIEALMAVSVSARRAELFKVVHVII